MTIIAKALYTLLVSHLDSSHELDLNQYQRATFRLVDREWVCRPPHYSPTRINSIFPEYEIDFYMGAPVYNNK